MHRARPIPAAGPRRPPRAPLASAALLLLLPLAGAPAASAQTSFPGLDEVAEQAVRNARAYKGPTVPPPLPAPWPEEARLLRRSATLPLAVHAPAGLRLPPGRVEAALRALEAARERLLAMGWPPPPPDGGLGGTQGFDLLLQPGAPRAAEALAAGRAPATALDAELAWARVEAELPPERLAACVAQAYAEAVLLGLDPAEATPWRRATAAWLAWRVTGRPGCTDAVARLQAEPWRSWIPEQDDPERDGAGGALLLELLDRLRGEGDGGLVRALWDLCRQHSRTDRAVALQGSPRLWEALRGMESARGPEGERLFEDLLVRLARLRWLWTGPGSPLPEVPRPPLSWEARWRQLPLHGAPSPPVEPLGSVFALVDLEREGPQAPTLKAWLRGEWGVHWSLQAVRLAADGRPLLPMVATPRKVPRAFLRVEPLGPVRRVLLVATNLSSRLPDPRLPDENVRATRLLLDADPRAPAR